MQEINVKLWRNYQDQNWSVEINGKRYESVSTELIQALVEHAQMAAGTDAIESRAES